jgi:Ca-activated chloride channel family protein
MQKSPIQALRTFSRHALAALAAGVIAFAAAPAEAAGVLVPRDGRAPVKVRSQRVSARLDDGLARTTVRQVFVSPHRGAMEAIYIFPVPEGAALVDVAMEVGGQRLEGLVVERQKARRIYDEIVRGNRDPALVEQIGHGTFRLSVFPVLPDVETVVELSWIQQAPLTDGKYRYVYPLALAGDAAETEQDLTFLLDITSSAPLTEVSSAVDGMDVVVRSKHAATASFERSRARLDEDLVVEASVQAPEASLAVRSFRDTDGSTYLAAVVTPPAAATKDWLARDITLVLDTSGSMRGEKIEQARKAAQFLIDRARDRDRVNVIRFSTAVDAFADGPVEMTMENRDKLRAFVAATEAKGSTALGDALKTALAEEVTEGRVRTVVLLTDGRPTVGITGSAEIVDLAKKGAGEKARVFAFGVGGDLDRALLHGISAATRGTAETFRPGGEIATRLSRFLVRTSTPVLADLRIDAPGAKLVEVYPRPVPDVYLGEQIVLATRIREGLPETIRVRANVGGKELTLEGDVPPRTAPGGDLSVRHLYGRQKIDFLEHALRLRHGLKDDAAYFAALDEGAYDTADEIVQDIVATSIDCGIQSAYASFLVLLPEDRARLDPRDLASLQEARERAAAARREATPRSPITTRRTATPPVSVTRASTPTPRSRVPAATGPRGSAAAPAARSGDAAAACATCAPAAAGRRRSLRSTSVSSGCGTTRTPPATGTRTGSTRSASSTSARTPTRASPTWAPRASRC